MIWINDELFLADNEVHMSAIRAQGSGGQHVNKVASAIHLRFDIHASSLAEDCKQRLLHRADHRLSAAGVIVIKAQAFRRQEQNREDAINRLRILIQAALHVPKSILLFSDSNGCLRQTHDYALMIANAVSAGRSHGSLC